MSENFFHIRTKDTFATMKLRVDIVTHNDSKIFDYTYFLPHLHYPNYLSMKREVIDQYLKKLFVQTSYPLHIKTHRNCVHGDSTWQRNVTVKYKKRRETTYQHNCSLAFHPVIWLILWKLQVYIYRLQMFPTYVHR